MSRPVLACTAAAHDELKRDPAAFRAATTLVGYAPDGDGGELELRNCPCGSTLAIELPAQAVAA